MDRRKLDVVVMSFLIAVGIIIITNDNWSFGGVESSIGSLTLPRVVAGLIVVFSLVIGVQSFLKLNLNQLQLDNEKIEMSGFFGVNLYVGIFIAYWFFTPYLGFLITTPVAMLGVAFLLQGRNWWVMLPVSVVTTFIVFYGCRHFLRVFLPTWSLG